MSETKKKGLSLDDISKIDPELAKEILDFRAKEAAGLIEYPRRTFKECRSWREAWIYIFHRARVEHSYYLKSDGGKVTCVVWPKADFNDELINSLRKIADRMGVNNDVNEMRLIGTRVTPLGIEKLKNILPKASIECYSLEQAKVHPKLKYVNTDVEWIKKLYAESQEDKP